MKKIELVILLVCVLLTSCKKTSNSSYPNYNDENTSEQRWESCEQCDGDGRLSRTCSTCDGTGRLISTHTETRTRSCSSCYGTGIAPCYSCGNYGYHRCTNCTMGSHRCPSCDGAGVHYSNGEFYKCYTCNESGYVTCSVCGGDGKITCSSCGGRGNIDCRTCDGTGGPDVSHTHSYDQGECPVCDGYGTVYDDCFKCDGTGRVEIE